MTSRGIAVLDTFDALNELATASVKRASSAKRVALTGSSGKTTLRAWLEHALGVLTRRVADHLHLFVQIEIHGLLRTGRTHDFPIAGRV